MDSSESLHSWAANQVTESVAGSGAAISAVSVAELCSYAMRDASSVSFHIRSMRVNMLDVPVMASEICGRAYRKYLDVRKADSKKDGPKTPLPDFFIGAHAELMGWEIVTGDVSRYRNYFPSVKLITP
jgi:predicted nucleic acid-binding protein